MNSLDLMFIDTSIYVYGMYVDSFYCNPTLRHIKHDRLLLNIPQTRLHNAFIAFHNPYTHYEKASPHTY